MKNIYPNLRLWLLPVLLTATYAGADGQKQAPPALTQLMSRQIAFIVHAPVILPSLLHQRQYQKMKNFLVNWKNPAPFVGTLSRSSPSLARLFFRRSVDQLCQKTDLVEGRCEHRHHGRKKPRRPDRW
jgi:hypothetical protein